MAQDTGDFPTVIGPDAKFKGELTFEKGVRIQGGFEGQVRTKGILHVAEGAKVAADVEAGDLKVEGEVKGNVNVSGKLTLCATARMEGDLRTNRIEMADGAVFVGNVIVGSQSGESARREQPAAAPPRDGQVRTRPISDGGIIGVPTLTVPGR